MTSPWKKMGMLAVAVMVILAGGSPAWGESLTAEQMYLDPQSIAPGSYTFSAPTGGGNTVTFSNVTALQVLPPLQSTGYDYYFTPCVDYTGDITDGGGTITLLRAGPYFILATHTDGSSELVDVGIDFRFVQPPGPGVRYQRAMDPPPGGDVLIVDPDLASPPWSVGGNPVVKDNLATWDDVTNYLKTLSNKHVELLGHGAPGEFYYRGQKVLDSGSGAWLDSMKGHINNLTFISCSTGKTCSLVSLAAEKLGASAGYTDTIGDSPAPGGGRQWYINDDGYRKVVPEPVTLALLPLGLVAAWRYARRRAA